MCDERHPVVGLRCIKDGTHDGEWCRTEKIKIDDSKDVYLWDSKQSK